MVRQHRLSYRTVLHYTVLGTSVLGDSSGGMGGRSMGKKDKVLLSTVEALTFTRGHLTTRCLTSDSSQIITAPSCCGTVCTDTTPARSVDAHLPYCTVVLWYSTLIYSIIVIPYFAVTRTLSIAE